MPNLLVYPRNAHETPEDVVEVLTNVGFGAVIEGDHARITDLYVGDADVDDAALDAQFELAEYHYRSEIVDA